MDSSLVYPLCSVDLYMPWMCGVFVCLGRSFSDTVFIAQAGLELTI